MSRTCVALLTILAVLAADRAAPVDAQVLPLPIPTRVRPKRTATPVLATRTPTPPPVATRTPTPVRTTAARPDMVPEISEVSLQLGATVASGDVAEGCAEATSGVDLLRFSVASRNIGNADLVLGDPGCPSPCADHPLEVCANPDFVCSPAAGHNHAHYDNYARYELLDAQGAVVVTGHKQGFCLRDTNCGAPVYTCSNQGISAGCSDVYHASLGCQYLDVTGIPAGSYVLRVTLDPLREIAELSDANNVVQQSVAIARPGHATPTRTPTPRPTLTQPVTPSVTPTQTARPSLTATPTRGVTPAPPSPVPTGDAVVAASCQRAILTAGRALAFRTFASVDACATAVAGCETGCRGRAVARCAEAMVELGAAQTTFRGRVTGRCADAGDAEMRLDSGLGFARRADECRDRFGATTDTVVGVAACLARQHVCRASALRATEDPRIGARLARGGALGAELCLTDRGGPDPEAPEIEESRALESCGRTIRRAGRHFVRRRLASVQACLTAQAACLGATTSREACVRRADDACRARAVRLDGDAARLAATVERGCGGLDFALVRSEVGLHLGATPACATFGVPGLDSLAEYTRCLARRHACAVDAILRFEAPHADEWVGTWPAPGGGCPAEPE